jgi:hypothetical protein
MTPDRKILSQMFKETALVSLGEKYGKPSAELREPQSPGSVVVIDNVPADAVVLKGKSAKPSGRKNPSCPTIRAASSVSATRTFPRRKRE